MNIERFHQQLRFIEEIDRLKLVHRQTLLMDSSRQENSAEHSWHLAMMALLLHEYADTPELDLLHVVKLVLVHDLVEIDAGDTFCYDTEANLDKATREQLAASRLFGLLPTDQAAEFRALWEEFEAQATPAARFANVLDRLQPLLHNNRTQGGTWRIHNVTRDRVVERMRPIQTGAPTLWPFVNQVLDEAVANGYLRPGP
jgi:putative hydrolase of HD superfamily